MKLQDGRITYIKKTTAVWLFQETERVSSDRLFRVRAKQPMSEEITTRTSHQKNNQLRRDCVAVGDVCAFHYSTSFRMGKVIQFIEFCGKQKTKPYRGNYVDLSSDCGIMCTWFTNKEKNTKFQMLPTTDNIYYHTKSYICTLTKASIVNASERKSVLNFGFLSNSLIIGTAFEITNETLTYINSQITTPIVDLTMIDDDPSQDAAAADSTKWLKCGNISLTQRDRSILMNGRKLTDNHIDAAQQLLQAQFNQIKGLQSPLFQNTRRLQQQRDVLQILHIDKWHWAVISTFGETNPDHVTYYDSMFSFLSPSTQSTIINLLQPKSSQLHVKIMVAPIQSGSTDCGLFAIAISTALAFGQNPSLEMYHQEDMRPHLQQCFVNQLMNPFPTKSTRRVDSFIKETVTIYVCPVCRMLENDNSKNMFGCDHCDNWYHDSCITSPPDIYNKRKWYCSDCSERPAV